LSQETSVLFFMCTYTTLSVGIHLPLHTTSFDLPLVVGPQSCVR